MINIIRGVQQILWRFLYCALNNTLKLFLMTGPHKYLKLGSQGSANSAQPIGMGVYYLTNDQYNKFPVYKMVGVEEYIFVDKSGCWSIYTETHPSMKGLYHPQRNPTPPEPPLTGWSYVNLLGEWKTDDPTLMLEKLPGVCDASVYLILISDH